MVDSTRSIKACAAYYGENADEMEAYLLDGEKSALELGNRGPIKFDQNGKLSEEIRAAYSKNGFYIFENVIDAKELEDIKEDLEQLRENFPTGPETTLDASRVVSGPVGKFSLNCSRSSFISSSSLASITFSNM